jgi:hypothetical protein
MRFTSFYGTRRNARDEMTRDELTRDEMTRDEMTAKK